MKTITAILSLASVAVGYAGGNDLSGRLSDARRRLQSDECAPSNQDLLTVVEIVMSQQSKLQAQKSTLTCLQSCVGGGPCLCGVEEATLQEPSTQTGVTLHLGMQVPQEQLVQLSAASQASLSQDDDCFLTPEEIAADPYATLLAQEFQAYVAGQIHSAGLDASDVEIFGFSSDADNTPGCNADVVGHSISINVGDGFQDTLGDSAAFEDCWLTPVEISEDDEAATFAAAFIEATAASLGVNPDQINLNGICVTNSLGQTCADANQPMGGGCA